MRLLRMCGAWKGFQFARRDVRTDGAANLLAGELTVASAIVVGMPQRRRRRRNESPKVIN